MNSVQYKDYLQHYGVKGMKWGVRNYENYDGTLTPAGKERYNDDNTKQKKNHDKLKKAAIVGGVAVASGLAIFGAYKIHQLTKDDRERIPVKDLESIPWLRVPEIDKSKIGTEEDFMNINPGVIDTPLTKNFELLKGSRTNCPFATTAWELRQRGYDVRPIEHKHGLPIDEIEKLWIGDRKFHNIGAEAMFDAEDRSDFFNVLSQKMVEKYPEGARGNLCFHYEPLLGGGGHSQCWEIKDGKFHIRDAQMHWYDATEFMSKQLERSMISQSSVRVLRTDDLTPSPQTFNLYMRTDSNTKHLLKHSPQAIIRLGTRTTEAKLASIGGLTLYSKHNLSNLTLISRYKKEHPNTTLSNKEILESLKKKG